MTISKIFFMFLLRNAVLIALSAILVGYIFHQWNPLRYDQNGRMFLVQIFFELLIVSNFFKLTECHHPDHRSRTSSR